jgi:hypothetical protein
MTQMEAKAQVLAQLEKVQGFDWAKLLAALPQIMALVQAIIDAFKTPTPPAA